MDIENLKRWKEFFVDGEKMILNVENHQNLDNKNIRDKATISYSSVTFGKGYDKGKKEAIIKAFQNLFITLENDLKSLKLRQPPFIIKGLEHKNETYFDRII